MLTLTEAAVTAIRYLASQSDAPDGAGVRIAPYDGEDISDLRLSLSEPDSADQVIESQGAQVFLAPIAASALEDKVLDAQIDDQGNVSFVLGEQSS